MKAAALASIVLTFWSVSTWAVAEEGISGYKNWAVQTSSDEMTDVRMVTAQYANDDIAIIVQCAHERVAAVIKPMNPVVSMGFITMDDKSEVIWRLGTEPAVQESWLNMDGGNGEHVLVSLDSDLVSQLRTKTEVLKVKIFGNVYSIPLEGAGPKIAEVLTACKV